ncbi:MAG: type II toxin-antitoxin system HicA family toxin [Patescibacteria group bacterium]|nr:type II toxin-antitoxin system HicA family toxin [Patescibacteria group bacterium]
MNKLAPVKRKKFEKFLNYAGCHLKRQKGDHLIYDRVGLRRPVVITTDSEVPIFIIRSNLRSLNIPIKEYLKIMSHLN